MKQLVKMSHTLVITYKIDILRVYGVIVCRSIQFNPSNDIGLHCIDYRSLLPSMRSKLAT